MNDDSAHPQFIPESPLRTWPPAWASISGEHLTEAAADRRSLAIVSRHIQREIRDIILPQQLEFPSSEAGLQRDSAARARQLSDFAKYSETIIKLCQLNLRDEGLRSRIETVVLEQLTEQQDARTGLAFSDCLPAAQRRLVQHLRTSDLLTDEDRRLIAISVEVLHESAQAGYAPDGREQTTRGGS